MNEPSGVPPRGTLLAFDFGTRRLGVAVGDRTLGTASALQTIAVRDGEPDWKALDGLVAEWQPVALLVGVPHHADGSESAIGALARRFGARLSERFGLPVDYVDESFTSREADAELRRKRRSGMLRRRVRRDDSDRIAARLILETWLARLDDAEREDST